MYNVKNFKIILYFHLLILTKRIKCVNYMHLPASGWLRSNIRRSFSLLPVRSWVPSSSKSTDLTMCLCVKECNSSPLKESQILLCRYNEKKDKQKWYFVNPLLKTFNLIPNFLHAQDIFMGFNARKRFVVVNIICKKKKTLFFCFNLFQSLNTG